MDVMVILNALARSCIGRYVSFKSELRSIIWLWRAGGCSTQLTGAEEKYITSNWKGIRNASPANPRKSIVNPADIFNC